MHRGEVESSTGWTLLQVWLTALNQSGPHASIVALVAGSSPMFVAVMVKVIVFPYLTAWGCVLVMLATTWGPLSAATEAGLAKLRRRSPRSSTMSSPVLSDVI